MPSYVVRSGSLKDGCWLVNNDDRVSSLCGFNEYISGWLFDLFNGWLIAVRQPRNWPKVSKNKQQPFFPPVLCVLFSCIFFLTCNILFQVIYFIMALSASALLSYTPPLYCSPPLHHFTLQVLAHCPLMASPQMWSFSLSLSRLRSLLPKASRCIALIQTHPMSLTIGQNTHR